MPTLRSHSVGSGKASPSPGAASASTSPVPRKKKSSKSSEPGIAAAAEHFAHTAVAALSLDPATPAGDREHALSSASQRPQAIGDPEHALSSPSQRPQTRGVVRTRQGLGQKKLLFSEQQQLLDHAEGAEEPAGRRSSKRVARGASKMEAVESEAMDVEAAVMPAPDTAAATDDEQRAIVAKGKLKIVELASDSEEEEADATDEQRRTIAAKGKLKSVELQAGSEGEEDVDMDADIEPSDSDEEIYARVCERMASGPRRRKRTASTDPGSRVEATKAKFLEIARRRAAHFAHFPAEKEAGSSAANNNGADSAPVDRSVDEQKKRVDELLAQVSADAGRPDNSDGQNQWPGPFVIARQLVEGREAAAVARSESSSRGVESHTKSTVEWTPSRKPLFSKNKVAPSLHSMCVDVLCNNVEHVQSLVGVTDAAKKAISARLCARRTMSTNAFRLYFSSDPGEIIVPDCTNVTEEILTEAVATCLTERLEVLELGMCGRAMSDQLCTSALAGSASALPVLHTLVLNGAYRLTDRGLKALVKAAPNLLNLNLKQCNMISAVGLEAVANSIGGTLRALSLDQCSQLDVVRILPPLMRMSGLKSLCLSGLGGLSDGIVSELMVVLGPHLRELFISDCKALTDAAIWAISLCCTGLEVLDIGHLPSLTDAAIGNLADGCRALKTLKLDRGKFSDTTLAALVTASGNCLTELSLNSVRQTGDLTVSALVKHSKGTLERLDLSFCRGVSDQALGLLADTCTGLQELRLFGCTQVTNLFVEGHSNTLLSVIGLPNCVLEVSKFSGY